MAAKLPDIMADKKQFQVIHNGLLVRAPAKINLTLLIAGKRADGFHELETLMAKVDCFDEILIQPSQKSGIEVVSEGPYWAPQGKENLIYQACKLLLDTCNCKADLKITLTKNIPAGSGLGSASSDAAATLVGVNKFLNLKVRHEKLAEMASELGSDVTFFLGGPLAFCMGKGEKIKKIEKKFNFFALLILPDISVSTKMVYNDYNHNNDRYNELKTKINEYLSKNRIDLTAEMCANMLQATCFDLHEELAELKVKIESLDFGPVCLSGSGSAMFCIVGYNNIDIGKVRGFQYELREKVGCKSILVSNNRW